MSPRPGHLVRLCLAFLGALLALSLASALDAAPAHASPASRTSGRPASANGASSSHLYFPATRRGVTEASVTLAIVRPPKTHDVYFWALQVGFLDRRGREIAGAHVGLQSHPAHPGGTAINWGGYDYATGRELAGSVSTLPSAAGSANTRDFAWVKNTPYTLRVRKVAAGWLAEVTDGRTGVTTPIRTLSVAATRIDVRAVFSESFAPCDASSTSVRWSGLARGTRLSVSYQSVADGGCSNSDQTVDGRGARQSTNVGRRVAPLAILSYR